MTGLAGAPIQYVVAGAGLTLGASAAPHVGGAVSLTLSGTGATASAITALATATSFWAKGRVQVNTIKALGNSSVWGLVYIDNNGSGGVFQIYITSTGTGGPYTLTVNAVGLGGVTTASVTQASLPANGQDVSFGAGYVNGTQRAYLFDGLGNVLAGGTASAFDGTITAGSGYVHVNGGGGTGGAFACVYDGVAVYTGTMPTAGSGNWWSKPASSDAGIGYLCYMNDAQSGTSPGTSVAAVGTTGLTWTAGQFAYTTDTTSGNWG